MTQHRHTRAELGQDGYSQGLSAFLFLVGVTLFLPRGTDVVVAAFLPEARAVLGEVLDGAQPLGALAAEQAGLDQAEWEAVFGGEGLAVVVCGREGAGGGEVGDLARR